MALAATVSVLAVAVAWAPLLTMASPYRSWGPSDFFRQFTLRLGESVKIQSPGFFRPYYKSAENAWNVLCLPTDSTALLISCYVNIEDTPLCYLSSLTIKTDAETRKHCGKERVEDFVSSTGFARFQFSSTGTALGEGFACKAKCLSPAEAAAIANTTTTPASATGENGSTDVGGGDLETVTDGEETLATVPNSKENLETVTDGEENLESVTDGEENLETVTDGEGNLETVTGGEENLETVTGGEENLETVTDGEENLETVTDGEENLETVTDGEGDLETVTDGEENLETMTDGEGNLETVTDGEEILETVTDGKENLETVTDGEENLETVTDGTETEDQKLREESFAAIIDALDSVIV